MRVCIITCIVAAAAAQAIAIGHNVYDAGCSPHCDYKSLTPDELRSNHSAELLYLLLGGLVCIASGAVVAIGCIFWIACFICVYVVGILASAILRARRRQLGIDIGDDPDPLPDDISRILKRPDELQAGGHACIICMEWRASICFVPCGHQQMCDDCVSQWWHKQCGNNWSCPMCRTPIDAIVRPVQ